MLAKLTKHCLINSILWEATRIHTINYDTQSVHGWKLVNFIDLFIRDNVVRQIVYFGIGGYSTRRSGRKQNLSVLTTKECRQLRNVCDLSTYIHTRPYSRANINKFS